MPIACLMDEVHVISKRSTHNLLVCLPAGIHPSSRSSIVIYIVWSSRRSEPLLPSRRKIVRASSGRCRRCCGCVSCRSRNGGQALSSIVGRFEQIVGQDAPTRRRSLIRCCSWGRRGRRCALRDQLATSRSRTARAHLRWERAKDGARSSCGRCGLHSTFSLRGRCEPPSPGAMDRAHLRRD